MKKNVPAFFVIFLFCFAAFGKVKVPSKNQTKREINNHKFASGINLELHNICKSNSIAFEEYFSRMSLEEKVSQLFIINLEGNSEYRCIDRMNNKPYVPGGYLFFSYNLAQTPVEVKAFTENIQDYCMTRGIIPPFLAVDEEGGDVQRLRKLAGRLPSQKTVAETMTPSEAYLFYSEHAKKVREMGFHMNLAPVVEILSDYNKDFLETRSFGDMEKTISYSISELNAYENKGIACVLKHFPGNTNTDPHTGLPEITLSKEELETSLIPFGRAVSLEPRAVLMSHARTSAVDEGVPACFSKKWVTEILRKEMGFNGIIFSDDIFMGALADNGYPQEIAAVKAVEAGIDCIMISEKRFLKPALSLIKKAENDPDFALRIDESCRRILKYKLEEGIFVLPQND